MFAKKKQPPISSLLAQGTRLDGDLQFEDGMRLDGMVHGSVTAGTARPSLLVISEHAVIEGSVAADHVIINGTVKGPVRARQLLELQPKARIQGDVSYQGLEMHLGAVVQGVLIPEPVAAAPAASAIPPQATLPNDAPGNA